MDKLKRNRGQRRGQITKLHTALNKPEIFNDVTSLKLKLEYLEGVYKELHQTQKCIEDLAADEQVDSEVDEWDIIQDSYETVKGKILRQIDALIAANVAAAQSKPLENSLQTSTSSGREVRLPKINLPTFNGKLENFTSFYDLFKSTIHINNHISEIEKFYYLRGSLEGEALSLIQSLPLTAANYTEAIKLLKERYSSVKLAVNTHFKALYGQASMSVQSASGLKKLIDETNAHVRALQNLEFSESKLWDLNLVHLITGKLDFETRKLWEQSLTGNDPATYAELKQFLEQQASILELINVKKSLKVSNAGPTITHRTYVSNEGSNNCPLCTLTHSLSQCHAFTKLSVEKRFEKAKELKVCINCLRSNHGTSKCDSKSKCKSCHKHHHTLLHREVPSTAVTAVPTSTKPETTTVTSPIPAPIAPNTLSKTLHTNLATNQQQLTPILPICYALASNDAGETMKVCVMLDSCSDSDYISTQLQKSLNLSSKFKQFSISGISGIVSTTSSYANCTLKSLCSDFSLAIQAPVLENITAAIPPIPLNTEQLQWIRNQATDFDEERCRHSSEIDVLLGAQHFFALLCGNVLKIPQSKIALVESKFGWVATGVAVTQPTRLRCNLAIDLSRFWEIEELTSSQRKKSAEELFAEDHFIQNTKRDSTGRFEVRLPFKLPPEKLGDTKHIAETRLKSMERRMRRDEDFRKQYYDFMNEYLSLGHMVMSSPSPDAYYLPHHAVLKPSSTTTKLRTVFDGSVAPNNGVSLNSALAVGPPLQPEIFHILIQFRMQHIALVADIEKMYRQIRVSELDTKYQQVLWRFSPEEPIASYNLQTVTYGTSAASFLAIRCLVQIAIEAEATAPEAAMAIQNQFLVDDFVGGANSVEAAIHLHTDLRRLLSSAGFHLRKWASNNEHALAGIPLADIATGGTVQFSLGENEPTTRTLGIKWSINEDLFIFSYPDIPKRDVLTKRLMLSDFSKFYDPLGLCSPIITRTKVFLQLLWAKELDWDDVIEDPGILSSYHELVADVRNLSQFTVPRIAAPFLNNEIHGFCDASEVAYAAVLYIRSTNNNNESQAQLLCAKTRVAPLKTTTIPRLELCAAQLLSQLAYEIANWLKITSVELWSDSSIVLNWIQKPPRTLSTFVGNRVSDIQKYTKNYTWRHIPTCLNPADIPTRPISGEQLHASTLWWQGPDFLRSPREYWPTSIIELVPDLPEQRTTICTQASRIEILFELYSTYTVLLRVSAYAYRFIYNCKVPLDKISGPLTVTEISAAKICLVKVIQRTEYSLTYDRLKSGEEIPKSDVLFFLTPILDEDDVIRIRGRLASTTLPFNIKHPAIIPAKHPFTRLVIRHFHFRNLHAGPLLTHNLIRQEFWLVGNARQQVRSTVRQCSICRRYNANATPAPMMGQLPTERATQTYPFMVTGIDYAGPFKVRNQPGAAVRQIYVAVFICFTVKAVHLEIVEDLSTPSYIAAMRRFTERRGMPRQMFSDNGTAFIGAARELDALFDFLRTHAAGISSALSAENIDWSFIPPNAPHMGGLWEAAVKSMKKHLKRTLGAQIPTLVEFVTLIIQIEGCLNSRPLTALPTDPTDEAPLTPAHFLIGRPLRSIPDRNANNQGSIYRRWSFVQNVRQQFWDAWYRDYLSELNRRTKWHQRQNPVQVGDIMLIKEDNTPPAHWAMGRIIKLHPGQDGITRVVDLKTATNVLRRPVVKLIPLVVQEDIN